MNYFFMFDEGEHGWVIIPIILLGLIAGTLAPIMLIITAAIYHWRLHYRFTWKKEIANRNEMTHDEYNAIR